MRPTIMASRHSTQGSEREQPARCRPSWRASWNSARFAPDSLDWSLGGIGGEETFAEGELEHLELLEGASIPCWVWAISPQSLPRK